MNNEEKIKQAAEILSKAKNIVGFTGAGTSAESGIPPFRGEGGIWNQYDPNSLDIDFYYRHTKESWKIIREVFYNFFSNKDIKPNPGHLVLAKWEKEGRLSSVITQNIDDLHTVAGNSVVYEFHGNMSRFVCTKCGHKVDAKSMKLTEEPPRCTQCGGLMKPDFIFFGEERDFFTEGVDSLYNALVAFLADSKRKTRNMARARSVAVNGICSEL